MKSGCQLITQERMRQIHSENWSEKHDDMHIGDELSCAAACYAVEGTDYMVTFNEEFAGHGYDAWPWDDEWDKREKHSRLRRLVIAGALIAAEIDRLQRKEATDEQH